MPDKDVDEQFAAIMAHWDDVALGIDPFGDPLADDGDRTPEVADSSEVDLGGVPHGTAEPDTTPPPATAQPAASSPPPVTAPPSAADTATPAAPPSDRMPVRPAAAPQPLPDDDAPPVVGSGWRQHDPPDVEEHFVPPPPAPLPSADDKHFWLMMVGLIGGPLLFLYLILFARDGNGWWMMFALGMAIAGFVLLVLRQPAERDENDDGVRL